MDRPLTTGGLFISLGYCLTSEPVLPVRRTHLWYFRSTYPHGLPVTYFIRATLMAMYPIATSTCTTLSSVTTCVMSVSTSTPLRVQDAGDLQFAFAWVIFFLSLISVGMIWNVISGVWK